MQESALLEGASTSRNTQGAANGKMCEVEKILNKHVNNGEIKYLIKWLGYPEEFNTWESSKNIINWKNVIQDFEEKIKKPEAVNNIGHKRQFPEDQITPMVSVDRQSVIKFARTNKMGSNPEASLVNVLNGKKYEIKVTKDSFIIGRNQKSSLIIEEQYMSGIQCSIDYTSTNLFILGDNCTNTGTFVNHKLLPKGKHVVLKHGDLIGFGFEEKLEYVYEFIIQNDERNKLSEVHAIENMKNEIAKYKTNLESLNSAVDKCKLDNITLKERVNLRMAECNRKLTSCLERFETIKIKQYELKCNIVRHLEEHFECSICTEVMIKATIVGSCYHSFCERCITTWAKKCRLCPNCRQIMSGKMNCLAIDNYIKDVYELVGGIKKLQRDTLLQEINGHHLRNPIIYIDITGDEPEHINPES